MVVAESLHAIIGHRRRGRPDDDRGRASCAWPTPSTSPRAAPACRSRRGRPNIHSLSAAAIDEVKISAARDRAVRVEIDMNNSAGVFQVDELLATKMRGSGLEEHVEVVARIDAEHEKRLVPVFRI